LNPGPSACEADVIPLLYASKVWLLTRGSYFEDLGIPRDFDRYWEIGGPISPELEKSTKKSAGQTTETSTDTSARRSTEKTCQDMSQIGAIDELGRS
jgi:hypothetical protein